MLSRTFCGKGPNTTPQRSLSTVSSSDARKLIFPYVIAEILKKWFKFREIIVDFLALAKTDMATQRAYGRGSSMPPLSGDTLRLYSMRFCPYAKRVRLVLAHKRIPYETININLTDKPEWYLELHPEGKIPLLQQGNRFLFESTIISEYLDDAYELNRLQQADPYRKAKEKLYLAQFSRVTDFLYKLHYNSETDSLLQEVMPTFIYYEELKKKLNLKYFGGDSPSLLDFMLWPWFETLTLIYELHPNLPIEHILPQSKYPHLRKWMEHMLQVQAVQDLHIPDIHRLYLRNLRCGRRDFDAGL